MVAWKPACAEAGATKLNNVPSVKNTVTPHFCLAPCKNFDFELLMIWQLAPEIWDNICSDLLIALGPKCTIQIKTLVEYSLFYDIMLKGCAGLNWCWTWTPPDHLSNACSVCWGKDLHFNVNFILRLCNRKILKVLSVIFESNDTDKTDIDNYAAWPQSSYNGWWKL